MDKSYEHSPEIDSILYYLKSDIRHDMNLLPRPFIVEFDGMPSCGKTTLVKKLETYFRHHGLSVFTPQESAEAIRHVPRITPEYNMRTALYTIQIIMDMSWNHTYDLILLDRGIFDCVCWADYCYDKHMITEKQKNTLKQYYLLPMFTDKIDCAVVMICEPEVALEREKNIELVAPHGFTTRQRLHEFYRRSRDLFVQNVLAYPQLHLLDTTNLTLQEMLCQAKDIVLNRINNNIKTA